MSRRLIFRPSAVMFSPTASLVRIVLLYALVAGVWIAVSDNAVAVLFADRAEITSFSILKGLLFVLLTSCLLYVLLRRFLRRIQRASDERAAALLLLEAISTNSSEAIFAKDLDGRYVLCNPAAAAFFGKPAEEVLGQTDETLFPPAEARAIVETDRQIKVRKAISTVEEVLPTVSGARFFETTKGPLFYPSDTLIGVFGVARDVTERRAAADRAENTAADLAATLKAIPDLLFDLDEDGVYCEVWARNPELLIQQRELVLGRRVIDVLPPDAARTVMEAIAEANARGASYDKTICLPTPAGTRWFELSTAKKTGNDNGHAHFMMLSHDVTRRFEAAAELSQHQEHLRLLMTHAPAALAMFDKNMRCLAVSNRWLADYNLTREESIGRSHYEVFPDLPDKWKEAHQQALAGIVVRADEDQFTMRDGSERWLRWEFHPWRQSDDGVGGVVMFTEDITARKITDAKITAYVDQIERFLRGSLQIVANAVEKRDPYTSGHEKRVGAIAVDIARAMGWEERRCIELEMIGMVHDVGKIGVPSEILTKPTRLTPAEFQLMKTHPQMGFDILTGIDFPNPVAEIVLQHHEHLDGSGYPRGLMGDAILPETRILTVADVLESMSAHRPYRPALGMEAALRELSKARQLVRLK